MRRGGKGDAISLIAFHNAPLFKAGFFTQKDLNNFIINVVCVNSEDIKTIQEKITKRFFEAVGQTDGIFLDVKLVGSIAHEKTGKFKSVISHCNDKGTLVV
jgi:hypothetical protein